MLVLLRARFWPAHVAMVVAVAAAVLLGLWQLNVWHAGRDAARHDPRTAKPVALSSLMGGDDAFPANGLGRPVRFRGTWMGSDTLFVGDRQLHGSHGYWVVTPVLVGHSAMPVVRGWSPDRSVPPVHGSVEVTGWLQPSEDSDAIDDDPHDDVLPAMQVSGIGERVDADLYSGFVIQRLAGATGLRQVTAQATEAVSGLTDLRNLLYALQWWIFGGFAIYVWQRWCRDQLEEPDAEEAAPASVG